MAEPEISYDEPSDCLYLTWVPGVFATGLMPHQYVLLRVDRANRRILSIMVHNFSILANGDEQLRRLPLDELTTMSEDSQELAMEVLRTPEVSKYLQLVAGGEIPAVVLHADRIVGQRR
jgi:hypothetical protein